MSGKHSVLVLLGKSFALEPKLTRNSQSSCILPVASVKQLCNLTTARILASGVGGCVCSGHPQLRCVFAGVPTAARDRPVRAGPAGAEPGSGLPLPIV